MSFPEGETNAEDMLVEKLAEALYLLACRGLNKYEKNITGDIRDE